MFLKPRFVCGLLEKSLFPVPRSWNTALNTSPKGKSFHELIRASSRLLCFLLNHRIYIFKFMCCMLDGLPISSIKQVKESDRSIFLVLFPKKSRSRSFTLSFQWPSMTPSISREWLQLFLWISSQSVPHYFHPLASEILKSSSTFPSFVFKTSFPRGVSYSQAWYQCSSRYPGSKLEWDPPNGFTCLCPVSCTLPPKL